SRARGASRARARSEPTPELGARVHRVAVGVQRWHGPRAKVAARGVDGGRARRLANEGEHQRLRRRRVGQLGSRWPRRHFPAPGARRRSAAFGQARRAEERFLARSRGADDCRGRRAVRGARLLDARALTHDFKSGLPRNSDTAKSTNARTRAAARLPSRWMTWMGIGSGSNSCKITRKRPAFSSEAAWYDSTRVTPSPATAPCMAISGLLTTKRALGRTARVRLPIRNDQAGGERSPEKQNVGNCRKSSGVCGRP